MQHVCKNDWCKQSFEVSDDDLAFYEKASPSFGGKRFDIPQPTMCGPCRRQARLMFRNFFNLYHRTCDLTGKKILSMYDTSVKFPVYEMHEWWSDKWEALEYGRDPDFSRSVFDQIQELHAAVPRMSIVNTQSENTDYCNMSFSSRNCYLVFGNVGNEDCAYGHIVWQSQNCFDCLYTYRSQFCYECIDCVQCHTLAFSRDCDNCSFSQFLVHCVGCKHCFGCVGLHNKEYHVFNEPHSKDEYEKKMHALNTGHIDTARVAQERVRQLTGTEIVKYYHGFNCENVVGDYLYNCKNIYDGYDLKNCEDCRYCATLESFTDCQDCNFCPAKSELCYQCVAVDGYRLLGCHNCFTSAADLLYCNECYSCKNCFGCAGLKGKQYCIFNKQYSPEEYPQTISRLIAQMQATGEWGTFFPAALSPFGYNETIASEYFPLTQTEAQDRGWHWKSKSEESRQYLGPETPLPKDIRDADDAITQNIQRCEVTGKLYKIIPQELAFLRNMRLPLPRKCFEQRQRERFALRNPRKLWKRSCGKCGKELETTYSPERPESVFCEKCYLASVY